jgi:hypothetical protein
MYVNGGVIGGTSVKVIIPNSASGTSLRAFKMDSFLQKWYVLPGKAEQTKRLWRRHMNRGPYSKHSCHAERTRPLSVHGNISSFYRQR